MNSKRGFVLLETIVVVVVLCTILIMLYGSYTNILINVQRKSFYDNTDYIYRTNIIREYFETNASISDLDYTSNIFTTYCHNDKLNTTNSCYSIEATGDYKNDLFNFLEVHAIYFSFWDVNESPEAYKIADPTTQNYIKYLDPEKLTSESGDRVYRIIVMFEPKEYENSYQYASLRFGSRG